EAALHKCVFTVWWAVLIVVGSRVAASIDEALQRADVILVLWSQGSIESDWVRDEAAQGRDRHRLVPLSLDGTLPPLGFRQIQTIDLSGWRGRADAPQLEAIKRAVATAMGQQAPPRPIAVSPRFSRRQLIASGAGATVALAGGGALVAWTSGLIGGSGAAARSIAVLPFKNLIGDPGQAYLPDG